MASAITDNFKQRVTDITLKDGRKIKIDIHLQQTQPMFVTNDAVFDTMVYKKTPSATVTVANEETFLNENGRFTFITKVTSYLTDATVELYYDSKYKDIIIIPDTTYYKFFANTELVTVNGYRVGTGEELSVNQVKTDLSLPVHETNGRVLLPEAKENIKAEVLLAAVPGLQSADFTQDANSYEEMLDDVINLKRYHRQLTNYIALGAYEDVFNGTDSIPLYVVMQNSPRNFRYKYLGNTKPKFKTKIYIPLSF